MSSKDIHKGHRQRLRERFEEEGLDSFADHQVLELLLFQVIPRADTNPIAHELLRRYGSISAVLEADPHDLAESPGMGPKAALFLSMLPSLTRRYLQDSAQHERAQLNTPEKSARYLIPLMAGRPEEVFYALCLDTQCRVIYPALISHGTIKDAHIHPRHVVETALRHRAASVILAHNHPSGKAQPSVSDHATTRVLVQALGPLDIKIFDHIIVAGESTFSFAREGVLPEYCAKD